MRTPQGIRVFDNEREVVVDVRDAVPLLNALHTQLAAAEQRATYEADVAAQAVAAKEAAERERDVAYDARRNADVYARRYEEQAESAMRERDEARTRAEQTESENQTLRQKIKDLTFIIENPKP